MTKDLLVCTWSAAHDSKREVQRWKPADIKNAQSAQRLLSFRAERERKDTDASSWK